MAAPEAAAAPAAYTPFLTDASRLWRVLFSPGAVFEEQRERPTVWMPWLVLTVVLLIIGAVMRPYSVRMIELAAQARGGGQAPPGGAAAIGATIAMVSTPVAFLLLALVSAFVMWLALLFTGGDVRFRGLMSAAVFSEAVAALQVAAQGVVLAIRGGVSAINSTADMQVGLGLNLLLSEDSTVPNFVQGVLSGIGPFQIWALALTAIGVATLERQGKAAAWTAAGASYVVLVLLGAVFYGRGA
jgi:hypothetical protein